MLRLALMIWLGPRAAYKDRFEASGGGSMLGRWFGRERREKLKDNEVRGVLPEESYTLLRWQQLIVNQLAVH